MRAGRRYHRTSNHTWQAVSDSEPVYGWIPGKAHYQPLTHLFHCALYKVNLKVTCRYCKRSVVIDAPGHWWLCERRKWDDSLREFSKRLYCRACHERQGQKVRFPKIEQTDQVQTGPLLAGPDHYTWKRIVNRQRS